MGLFVGSTPIKAVYVGSTPVKAVYVGEKKIWPSDPRVVTLQVAFAKFSSASGDLSLLSAITSSGTAIFTAPVTCSEATWVDGVFLAAGNRISAGVEVKSAASRAHVFTEIL